MAAVTLVTHVGLRCVGVDAVWVGSGLLAYLVVCTPGCLVLGSGRETYSVTEPVLLSALLTRFCWCVGVGQALGLLVPVGWALLLYTSGLSTP